MTSISDQSIQPFTLQMYSYCEDFIVMWYLLCMRRQINYGKAKKNKIISSQAITFENRARVGGVFFLYLFFLNGINKKNVRQTL